MDMLAGHAFLHQKKQNVSNVHARGHGAHHGPSVAYPLRREDGQRIVVILTSNSEKNLPDAFLRRCVFYHIPFPDKEQLMAIAKTQLGDATRFTELLLEELVTKFNAVRDHAVRKAPATAELLAWLQVLDLQDYVSSAEGKRKEIALQNLSLLVKTREDMEAVKKLF